MTYDFAKMVVWNPETYERETVVAAALFLIASFGVSEEDFLQAASLV